MAKYRLSALATVSCHTEVEAASREEALEIAEGRELGTLCHNPFCGDEDEVWHFDGDGEPTDITFAD